MIVRASPGGIGVLGPQGVRWIRSEGRYLDQTSDSYLLSDAEGVIEVFKLGGERRVYSGREFRAGTVMYDQKCLCLATSTGFILVELETGRVLDRQICDWHKVIDADTIRFRLPGGHPLFDPDRYFELDLGTGDRRKALPFDEDSEPAEYEARGALAVRNGRELYDRRTGTLILGLSKADSFWGKIALSHEGDRAAAVMEQGNHRLVVVDSTGRAGIFNLLATELAWLHAVGSPVQNK